MTTATEVRAFRRVEQGGATRRLLSLGAGVQSSTLLLMAARGEFEHVPDAAIFADTGWEPKAVYNWLAFLEDEVRGVIPIHRVTAGNIRKDAVHSAGGGSKRFASIPVYVASPDGEREGMLKRQCTKDYKIEPTQRRCAELVGLRPRQRRPKAPVIELWMGISMDEVQRMKPSREIWIEHRWPLIERGMDRRACLRWLAANGYPTAPKSACIGCPFHADHQWRDMRDNDPDSWRDAVEFDRAIRTFPRIKGEAYLHRSLVPLDQVDLSTAEDRGQGNMFDGECEGVCGV